MKDSLQPGLKFEFQFQVPETKTVPHLYPESPEFQAMPRVLATGYMVGLFEWACIQALNPHLDWPREQTVGIHVNLSHTAATPPGMVVTVRVPPREGGRPQAHLVHRSRRRRRPDFPGLPRALRHRRRQVQHQG